MVPHLEHLSFLANILNLQVPHYQSPLSKRVDNAGGCAYSLINGGTDCADSGRNTNVVFDSCSEIHM